ncbi:hypothetical protein [Streptomyces sp. NPDC002788]
MGHRLHAAGRWLITEAVASVYGLKVTGRDLARDEHARWNLPKYGLTASVTHCGEFSAVALSSGLTVGVDLQDDRHRPHAMQWLGALLGRPPGEPASIRDFAECEVLIKASHVTKETFAGLRLPTWRPGWRATGTGYHVRSGAFGSGMHLALAADAVAPVLWWWRPRPSEKAQRTETPTWETT